MKGVYYNQVWEDPEVDGLGLQIGKNDRLLMVTSAGCNVLNLLLREPRSIVAIDSNLHQQRLFAHKLKLIEGNYKQLWEEYGIPAQARQSSIYSYGAYSRFAWIHQFLKRVCGKSNVAAFLEAQSLEEQADIYRNLLEPRLWNPVVRHFPLAFAYVCGMHWRQLYYASRARQFTLMQACSKRLREVLTGFPIRKNYFWHQMFAGSYASNVDAPEYLNPANFHKLQALSSRVENRHANLLDYLSTAPANSFDGVALLDVPEFLSPPRRASLFQSLERVCSPGARILFRSFAPGMKIQSDVLRFQSEQSIQLSRIERTASYASVHLYKKAMT